ncbi:phosphorothioated DNA-binding restriction endonuclease [Roseateles sp. BYS87W]|uniref:Phosphorothioated DNA-binding restriction endonuclease n=1 Tax=Pelomonas baiyunensis TaxID=3299026 RepID=A0ABW7H5A8_9BURK
MKSPIEVLNAFDAIRPAQAGDGYKPHKPLLLLLSLGRVQRGEPRLAEFTEIEQRLKNLLLEFGPTNSESRRHLPFWHLHTDLGGALWDLSGPAALLNRPAANTPNIGELRANRVAGGFHPDVDACLRSTPGLVAACAHKVLEKYFPGTLREDIAAAAAVDLDEPSWVAEATGTYQVTQPAKRRRSGEFRDRVLRAYEFRCCVCGFDLRIGHIPAGLEAAHIMWHHVGGPDVEPNGLSLCALHHKLFDLGAFTVEPNSYRVLFSQHAVSGERGLSGAMQHHGKAIYLPVDLQHRPAQEYLSWNMNSVFKKPWWTICN